MSKWLVTGGEGFIGGRITTLTEAVPYDLKSGCNILDSEKMLRASDGMSGIFHCAARISVPESIEQPDAYYLNNVKGTESVIQAAVERNAKIVFSSSAAVYGESDKAVSETDSLNPLSPYAENKRDGENLLTKSSISSVILRYFNVYGPGQSAAYAGVVTAFIRAAIKGDDLIVYGNGEQVRDFIFVDDVAKANITAMESNIQNAEVFNIGSGTHTSINQLAEEVMRLTNSSSSIIYADSRPGDIVYSQANITKAQKIMDWRAQVSLREGLEKTIEFYRS